MRIDETGIDFQQDPKPTPAPQPVQEPQPSAPQVDWDAIIASPNTFETPKQEGQPVDWDAIIAQPDPWHAAEIARKVALSVTHDPAQYAEAQKLGAALGIAPNLVLQSPEVMREMARRREIADLQLEKDSPFLAARMDDLEFARIAHADLEKLKGIESLFASTFGIQAQRAFEQGQLQSEGGLLQHLKRNKIATPEQLKRLDEINVRMRSLEWFNPEGFVAGSSRVVGQLAETAPTMLASGMVGAGIGATWGALGGPLAPATSSAGAFTGFVSGVFAATGVQAYQIEGGLHYQDLIDQGYSHEVANEQATLYGLGASAFEMMGGAAAMTGAGFILKPLVGKVRQTIFRETAKSLVQTTLGGALKTGAAGYIVGVSGEVAEETMQRALEMWSEEAARQQEPGANPNGSTWSRGEAIQSLADTIKQTFEGVALLGVPGTGFSVMRDVAKIRKAEETQKFLGKLEKGVSSAEVARHSPERTEEFLAQVAKGHAVPTLYFDAEAVREVLAQSDLSPEEMNKALPGVAEQLATPGVVDITLPTAKYALLGDSGLRKDLALYARVSADDYSMAEVETLQQAEKAVPEPSAEEVAQKAVEKERIKKFREEARTVEQEVTKQLKDLLPAHEVPVAAKWYRGFVERMATETKMSPAQFQQEHGLKYGEINQGLSQPSLRTDTPEFKAWFGESKVVDEKGAPLRVYHGTNRDFGAFSSNGASSKTGNPNAQLGFFLSDSASEASRYAKDWGASGGRVMPVYVSLRNPYRMPYKEFDDLAMAEYRGLSDMVVKGQPTAEQKERIAAAQDGARKAARQRRDELIAEGFDGVVVKIGGGHEYIAFEPSQIKSVNNRGTWDANDPNILNQPNRAQFSPKDLMMDLTKPHDASSWFHEFSHYTVTLLAKFASQENASPELAQDMQTILDWFGVKDIAAWNSLSLKQQEPLHEQFAYNYEVWITTGAAPSVEMASIFRRIAAWMADVYKDIVGQLNRKYRELFGKDLPALTPEVRTVMARLTNSADAVERMQEIRDLTPQFQTATEYFAADPTRTEADWFAYQDLVAKQKQEAQDALRADTMRGLSWAVRTKEQELKKLQAAREAALDVIRAEVKAEVEQEGVYRARRWIKKGEVLQPDGTVDREPDGVPHKLDEALALALLGDGIDPETLKGYTVKTGGLNPEHVAEVFDYKGENRGTMLVRDLATRPSLGEAIDARAEAKMDIRHPELSPKEMEAAATDAIHNEARARMVAAEFKHLSRSKTPVRVLREAAKLEAGRILDKTAIEDIQPSAYSIAAGKAARKAREASAAGKSDEAAEWMRKQLLQDALARESIDLRKQIDGAVDDFKRLAATDKKLGKTRDIDLIYVARIIAAKFGLGDKAQSVQEEALRAQALQELPAQSQQLSDLATTALGLPYSGYKDMPYSDFVKLVEAHDALWSASKRNMQLDAEGKGILVQEAQNELKGRIAVLPARPASAKPKPGRTVADGGSFILKGWGSFASIKRMESWARFMDGGKRGAFTKYLVEPIIRMADAYRAKMRELVNKLVPRIAERKQAAGEAWDADIYSKELDWTFRGKKELLGMLEHIGTESSLAKLVRGRNWGSMVTDPETGERSVDYTRFNAFLDRMFDKEVITKEDMDFVQFSWSLYAELLPMAQKTHKQLYGYEFETIEHRKIDTPWGVIEGGYAPARVARDEDPSPRIESGSDEDILKGLSDDFAFSVGTGKGFTLERNPNYNKPLNLNIADQVSALEAETRFIYLQPVISDALRLVRANSKDENGTRNQSFKEALDAYDTVAINRIVMPFITNAASQSTTKPGNPVVSPIAKWARQAASLRYLGFNIFNSLAQLTGFGNLGVDVKGRYRRAAFSMVASDFKGATKVAMEKSTAIVNRLDTHTRKMQQYARRMGMAPWKRTLQAAQDTSANAAFFLQRFSQSLVDVVSWHASYQQSIAEAPAGMDAAEVEAQAVAAADSTVRRVQGSQNPEDLASFENGTEMQKLMFQFGNYGNTVLQSVISAPKGKKLAAFAWVVLLPAMLEATLKLLVMGGPEDKDDDGSYLDDVAGFYGKSLGRGVTGLLPGIGSIMMTSIESEGERMAASPAGEMARNAMLGVFAVGDLIGGDDMTEKQKDRAIRAVGDLLTYMTRLPFHIPARTIAHLTTAEEPSVRGAIVGR